MLKLYPYQKEYLRDMPKNHIMSADVGLGKSAMALNHYDTHNRGGRLLIVAPASKVKTGDWQREVKKFLNYEPEFDVISYERLTKDWQKYYGDDLTVIADEGHFVQNSQAKRSKAFLRLAKGAKQWIILTATPLPNGWRSGETYAILTELARNKTQFVQRFQMIDRSRGFPLLLGYREEDTLKDWWSKWAKPLARTGDMILPSETIGCYIEMAPKTLREYNRIKKERTYGDELLDSAPKLFARLRQFTVESRLNEVEAILDSTDEHIVIFYNYNIERELLIELAEKKDRVIYEQSGHASNLPKREDWDNLKPSVTLAQYQSASQAIELTYASVGIYMSPTYSYANFEQSLGRMRRNGQKKVVINYMLNVKGSIDNEVWKALKNKKDFSEREVML